MHEEAIAFAIYSVSCGMGLMLAGIGISCIIQSLRTYSYDCHYSDSRDKDNSEEEPD